jgi:predicted amidophosphoribosyltransferase
LIDDVRTTGSTLAEAAAALTATGHEVTTLALAWSAG